MRINETTIEPGSTPAAVRRILNISTAHLPEHLGTDTRPGLNGYDGVSAEGLRNGWLVMVPDNPVEHAADYGDPEELDGVPSELLAVQAYARALGCDWIRFDADGDMLDGLPRWDW